jgi:hypothetical protein
MRTGAAAGEAAATTVPAIGEAAVTTVATAGEAATTAVAAAGDAAATWVATGEAAATAVAAAGEAAVATAATVGAVGAGAAVQAVSPTSRPAARLEPTDPKSLFTVVASSYVIRGPRAASIPELPSPGSYRPLCQSQRHRRSNGPGTILTGQRTGRDVRYYREQAAFHIRTFLTHGDDRLSACWTKNGRVSYRPPSPSGSAMSPLDGGHDTVDLPSRTGCRLVQNLLRASGLADSGMRSRLPN